MYATTYFTFTVVDMNIPLEMVIYVETEKFCAPYLLLFIRAYIKAYVWW